MSPLAKAYIQLRLRGEPGDVALRALLLSWGLESRRFLVARTQRSDWRPSDIARELLRQEGIDV